MSKASQFILLCEDKLQEVIARRFLLEHGVPNRVIRVERCADDGSGGAGEKYVRDRYPNELEACRTRHASTALIVMIDADTSTVADRNRQLDEACSNRDIQPRGMHEPIAYIIPRRNIETWLAHLNGVDVDERTNYKPEYSFRGAEADSRHLVKKFVEWCRQQEMPGDPPASLRTACEEFVRIRPMLS